MDKEIKDELAKWQRLDNRRTTGADMGASPNVDSGDELAKDQHEPREETTYPHRAEQGFWKKSEDLACRAGRPMTTDARGLPPGYATGHPFRRNEEDYPSKGGC